MTEKLETNTEEREDKLNTKTNKNRETFFDKTIIILKHHALKTFTQK